MKNLITVIKFSIREMIRKKSFLISTIIILALVVIACALPRIISALQENDSKDTIVIVDEDNIFEGNLEALKQMDLPKYKIIIENLNFDELKEKIENKAIESAIIIENNNENINLKYLVKNKTWVREVPQDLFGAITSVYSSMQISKLGLTQEELKMITPNFEISIEQTKEEQVDDSSILLMMTFSLALSIAIIFFTAQVATSITTEKTSKVMETLVTSTTPKTIVLGKTIGIGLVGLLQIILIITTAFISANLLIDPEILNGFFNVANITPGFILLTLVYFILGYFAYALLYALTGSLVTKPEDIQSANTPVSIIAVIGYYLGYFSISIDPTSNIASFAGMFPLSSAFCMPARVMMGLASFQDVAISLVLLVIMVALIAKVAIKVYSNAILNYGSKLSLKDALKMYKEK